MLKTKRGVVNPDSLPLCGCSCSNRLFLGGMLRVPCHLLHHPSTTARGMDAVSGASLCDPDEQGGTRPALLHGRVWGASRAKVAVGKAAVAGGRAPNSWRSAVHTRLISPSRVCAAGSQPPWWGGRAVSTHKRPPSSSLFHLRVPRRVSKLCCVLL